MDPDERGVDQHNRGQEADLGEPEPFGTLLDGLQQIVPQLVVSLKIIIIG